MVVCDTIVVLVDFVIVLHDDVMMVVVTSGTFCCGCYCGC